MQKITVALDDKELKKALSKINFAEKIFIGNYEYNSTFVTFLENKNGMNSLHWENKVLQIDFKDLEPFGFFYFVYKSKIDKIVFDNQESFVKFTQLPEELIMLKIDNQIILTPLEIYDKTDLKFWIILAHSKDCEFFLYGNFVPYKGKLYESYEQAKKDLIELLKEKKMNQEIKNKNNFTKRKN